MLLETRGMHERRWKRYPAYRDSGVEWLGDVPEGWEVKRLKRMFRVINGSTPKSGIFEYWDGDISWVTPDDLGRLKSNTIDETVRKITALGYQSCGTTLAPAGSLVLSTRAPIGHLAIAEIDLCTNQGCRSLIFKYGDNKRYFYCQLLAARPELESLGQGSTFRELGKSKLEAIELFSPPLPEQHAIADFLDRETAKIDELAAKKERLVELLDEKRTALISHAVTKGLDPDAPMKDSGIEWLGDVPEGWEIRRNGALFMQRDERGYPDLPLLSVSLHTGTSVREFSSDRIEQMAEDRSTYKRAKKGDIVFNKMRMWQGAVGVAPTDGLVSTDYTVAKPLEGVQPRYFEHLFRTSFYKTETNRYSYGIVPDRNRLYWDRFKQMPSIYQTDAVDLPALQ